MRPLQSLFMRSEPSVYAYVVLTSDRSKEGVLIVEDSTHNVLLSPAPVKARGKFDNQTGADIPYFLENGGTPPGIYLVTGVRRCNPPKSGGSDSNYAECLREFGPGERLELIGIAGEAGFFASAESAYRSLLRSHSGSLTGNIIPFPLPLDGTKGCLRVHMDTQQQLNQIFHYAASRGEPMYYCVLEYDSGISPPDMNGIRSQCKNIFYDNENQCRMNDQSSQMPDINGSFLVPRTRP